uniref:tetraspanin-2 isoform X1 n=1 Tax=Agelaius phoeniceus TaxID=39638 RepID=UPI0023EB0329|nr:tetraspanin-2 isoform X1 [Agelaius phoeniceus]
MGVGYGGMRCVKILLFIFNLTFWLAGLAVIAFGLWLRFGGPMAEFATDKKSPELFFMGLYVLVGAGAIMSAVGFFGCCGAARESQCLIGTFFACLLVIFAGEVTAGVFAFIGKKVAIQEAQKIYEDAYEDYMKNPVGKVNSTIYRYHVALQCCGKGGVEQPTGLPCPENIQLPKNCLAEIQNVIDTQLRLVGIVGIAIASITVSKSIAPIFLEPSTLPLTQRFVEGVLQQLVRFLNSSCFQCVFSLGIAPISASRAV